MRRFVALGCAALFALALLPGVAQADFAWTGGSTTPNWSDSANWSGGTAPIANTDVGALSFPAPSGCTGTCDSDNDRGGLSADSLTIDDNVRYALTGIGISLGSGGLTATSSGGSGGPAGIDLPLVLTAAQTWAFNGGAGGLDLQNAVTGGQAVTVNFASPAFLEFDASATLGSLTAAGPGSLYLYGSGAISGPVALSNEMTLGNNALSSSTGALTLTGSELDDGYGSSQDATLAVNGAFAMDSASKLKMYIDQDGQNPGTAFSQLTATGNVTLAGTLEVDAGYDGNGNCTPLSPGDTAELLSTTGTVTGTFDPHVVTNSSCDGTVPQIQITYGSSDVSAEVVSNTTTTLAAPSTAQTNQPVTLTATVTPDTGSPTGTVAFDNSGTPIPGCSAQPVSSGSATCVTSFIYSAPAPSLTASFTGTGGYLSSATTAASTISITPGTPSSPAPASTPPPASPPPASTPPTSTPPPATSPPTGPPAYTGTLSLTASKVTVTHGAVHVPQQCTSLAPCTGRFTIAVKGRSCASGAYSVGAFKRATAQAKLSSTCMRLLKKASHHRLAATYRSSPQTPQAAQVKKITLALS